MKKLKKNLQDVNKDLKALAKKVYRMIVEMDKLEKPKAVKAKPAKKTAPKVKPVKTIAAKKPEVKKTDKLTAVDTVLGVIERSKKGVNVSTLTEKTGFNKKKIYNNVTVLKKQGKIKSVDWGAYLKA